MSHLWVISVFHRDVMRSALFWGFTQRTVVRTDVSGQPIGPIFKGQTVLLDRTFARKLSKN